MPKRRKARVKRQIDRAFAGTKKAYKKKRPMKKPKKAKGY